MSLPAKSDIAATTLTACILGLATCPFPYIVIGAPLQFKAAFSFILLPPFLVGSSFLLWRYLGRPPKADGRVSLLVAEILSWAGVAVFLFFVSRFSLMGTAQRIGLASMFLLLTSFVWLPVVIWRETVLEARIKRLPRAVSVLALLILVAVAASAIAAYFLIPPHLI